MKGATGLIVAVFLGLTASVLNWFYLDSKTRDIQNMSFVGIKDGVTLKGGELVRRDQLEEVPIPERFGKKLINVVHPWADVSTIVDRPVPRDIPGGQLFFRHYSTTPPRELELEPNEVHYVVTVDSGSLVPELINPGDRITFVVPSMSREPQPTPAGSAPLSRPESPLSVIEQIGPFRVKSLGSRLGSIDATRATRMSSAQERQIGVVVDLSNPAEKLQLEKLQQRISFGEGRSLQVLLHSRRG
jgi:hypothetical protein